MKLKLTHILSLGCAALTALSLLLGLSACGPKPLLSEVTVAPEVITPNADGKTDLASVRFMLNRNAVVSILLEDAQGRSYTFRPPTRLSLNDEPYAVYFGGVVEGFDLPDDPPLDYTVLKRMLPDGVYTWRIQAKTDAGERQAVTGTLTLQDADTSLPGIRGFSVSPKQFSPNQDGIDDRVRINLALEKDVEDLRVYLEGADGVPHHIAEDENEQVTPPNQKGFHTYDYDGGIDAGTNPPEDGTYVVYAEARDAMGQRARVSQTLDIVNAGLPRAYITNAEVDYSAQTLVLSDTLCFTLTVENDSDTYLRTIGPWPGATYRSDQNYNTLGWEQESGAYRVAMNYDTSLRDYPYRWGIGRPGEELVQIDEDWYLPPRARSLVTGCLRIVEVPVRNPLYYWMGLIHEDVGIQNVNNRVDPNFVTIWEP
jgi:hypothetical protein